jgi:hypothetical protein
MHAASIQREISLEVTSAAWIERATSTENEDDFYSSKYDYRLFVYV